MKDVDAVSITEASDGCVFITIRKESGYSDDYRLQPREAKYLFNKFGKVLERVGENDDPDE